MSTVIQVENISKLYRLGNVGSGTLKDDLGRWWQRVRGKEDPLMLAGAVNDRTQKAESDYVWALKDINFEVQQGDVLGIIGRNGAGKSTLLKILSKTTAPTMGSVKVKGRIASLLEVGTGFHPELTGRENIYLNGAILGMRKHEITRKLDEIIDFAGVERYIDTPVKRYSSGMYVRLAFGVAAHLEPEILIVDEVLAVGDADFQRKCLGKMRDVSSNQGRTVLFVSHNMDAVLALCTNIICLENGIINYLGNTKQGIEQYFSIGQKNQGIYIGEIREQPSIIKAQVFTSDDHYVHKNGEDLFIDIDINMPDYTEGMAVSFQIINQKDNSCIFAYIFDVDNPILRLRGINKLRCTLPNCQLYQGQYSITFHLAESKGRVKFQEVNNVCSFEVKMFRKPIEWGWQEGICVYTQDFNWREL